MKRVLRIGTRDSELALWQAHTVREQLARHGQPAELVPVKSEGDLKLDKPLYELGITGIFTRTLDVALLRGDIDLAVHSMKDVPTALPVGICEAAVLERANPLDVLVHKGLGFLDGAGVVATGSLRRKAQWLNRYPAHEVVGLRGNVNTRLRRLEESGWDAAIFAVAGLERIGLLPDPPHILDWMLPAPAQGAMLVVARSADAFAREVVAPLNHQETALRVGTERAFLRTLEGGCTAPIGALASLEGNDLVLKGGLYALDGSRAVRVEKSIRLENYPQAQTGTSFGADCARELLDSGGATLMEEIRNSMSP